MKKFFLLIFLNIISFSAKAFVENYSFFGSEEERDINGPQNIDGEYYSDLFAFRLNVSHDFNFLNSTNAYDMYVGSISSKKFATQQRLKLHHKISKKLFFDLVYLEKENFEEARKQFMSGLTFQFLDGFSVSAYTSLNSDKSKNDVGVSINMNTHQNHQIKLFANLVDFDFSKRNDVDAQDHKKPMNIGLSGVWLGEKMQYLQYYIFQNTSVERESLSLNEKYIFEELRYGLRGKKRFTKDWDINFDFEGFTGKEGRFSTVSYDPNTDVIWNREGLRFLGQFESLKTIWGLEYNYRHWSADQGSITHSNVMPHVWYKMLLNQNALILPHNIDLGLEASFHKASGPVSLRSSTDKDSDINSRFNLRLHYKFSETAFLNLLLSADLDDKFSWEGGGGQFQTLF